MSKYNIGAANIEFKNLFSGPAPIGRILNYINLVGTTGLKHRNGNRTVYSPDGVGYAWTTEFMIGLGLVELGDHVGTAIKLKLTPKGTLLFELIKNRSASFHDGFRDGDIEIVKSQITACHPDLYETFRNVFVESYPFLILLDYLEEYGYHFPHLRGFYDDFFSWAGNLYGTGAEGNNAGFNRIPSLVQLCKLFGIVKTDNGITFNKIAIDKLNISKPAEVQTETNGKTAVNHKISINKPEAIHNNAAVSKTDGDTADPIYTQTEMIKAAAEEHAVIKASTKDLVSTYGEYGNIIVSAIVRNSSLQAKFKHNLSVQQKSRCVICGMENKELLIGSHIKASAESNVFEKIDHNNGLLLCCNHDKLFDRHLITFNCDNGKIEISDSLSEKDMQLLGLSEDFTLPEEMLTFERKEYLKWHNNNFKIQEQNRKQK